MLNDLLLFGRESFRITPGQAPDDPRAIGQVVTASDTDESVATATDFFILCQFRTAA
jgi:hypothetical protein